MSGPKSLGSSSDWDARGGPERDLYQLAIEQHGLSGDHHIRETGLVNVAFDAPIRHVDGHAGHAGRGLRIQTNFGDIDVRNGSLRTLARRLAALARPEILSPVRRIHLPPL